VKTRTENLRRNRETEVMNSRRGVNRCKEYGSKCSLVYTCVQDVKTQGINQKCRRGS